MKKYIQVQPKQSSKAKVFVLAVVILIGYGLVVNPAATAEIVKTVGAALAGVADGVLDFLQGL